MNYEFGKHSHEYSIEYSYNSYVLRNLNNPKITVKCDLHTDMLDNDNFWKTLPRRYKTCLMSLSGNRHVIRIHFGCET